MINLIANKIPTHPNVKFLSHPNIRRITDPFSSPRLRIPHQVPRRARLSLRDPPRTSLSHKVDAQDSSGVRRSYSLCRLARAYAQLELVTLQADATALRQQQ